jgi:hypothetical protein
MNRKALEAVREGTGLIREGLAKFDGGPWDFYLRELLASYELLTTRFTPFPLDSPVKLKRTPTITPTKGHGWLEYKDVLKKGAPGRVREVECGEGGFRFSVEFQGALGHYFSFKEGWLEEDPT